MDYANSEQGISLQCVLLSLTHLTLSVDIWRKCLMCQECFLRGCLEGPSLIYFSVRAFMLAIGYVPLFGESRPALFNCPRFTDATASMFVVAGPSVNVVWERRSPQR